MDWVKVAFREDSFDEENEGWGSVFLNMSWTNWWVRGTLELPIESGARARSRDRDRCLRDVRSSQECS